MAELIDRSGQHRPVIMGTKAMVSSGHSQATLAGLEINKKGGNAIDAGVAMGICINVLQPEFTNFGGIAPIMIYSKDADKIITISGVGTWPDAISIELINKRGGKINSDQFTSSVVPGAPDAWITALDLFGTKSFSDVVKRAIELAQYGFPAYPFLINNLIRSFKKDNSARTHMNWDYTKSVFFPSGVAPHLGELIIQKDLARTLKRLVRVEKRNRHLGRHEGLMAVRDEFYKGDIAKEIIGYLQEKGGVMTMEDMGKFHVGLEDPVKTTYKDIDVYCCGPWTNGPVHAIALNILEGYELCSMEHNSAEYIHLLASAINLGFADREKYFGDPLFVDVPINKLLSKKYAEIRRELIYMDKAWEEMPPPGDPVKLKAIASNVKKQNLETRGGLGRDTSFGCAVDGDGNAFGVTTSDGAGRLVPGLGILISTRGSQSRLNLDHPNAVLPGKRPISSSQPAMAFKDGEIFMVYGTPGSDSQPQTMTQILMNIVEFNMNVQQSIEAPRFRSWNFPESWWPHKYLPGRLSVESRVPQKTITKLKELGYDLEIYPEWTWSCGGPCAIHVDGKYGTLMGGADPRRACYAIGY